VLSSHPELAPCVKRCVHCGIRFLTHPRNAWRETVRCPFGCREHRRRECARQRTKAYYSTRAGQAKKKKLNMRRARGNPAAATKQELNPAEASPAQAGHQAPLARAASPPSPELLAVEPAVSCALRLDEFVLDEASVTNSRVLPYVTVVVNLIEGTAFSGGEIVQRLRQAVRQHSFGRESRSDYVLRWLHDHPPWEDTDARERGIRDSEPAL